MARHQGCFTERRLDTPLPGACFMSPRRMLVRLLLVLAGFVPGSLAAQSVTPDGDTQSVNPNTTGNLALFNVSNETSMAQTYWLGCQFSGAVSSCQSPGSVTVEAWSNAHVEVTYSTGSPGTGRVELYLDGSDWDMGWYDITVLGPARYTPTLDLTPHNGENRSMALCAAGCFDATGAYTTPAYFSMDTPRSLTLLYRSSQALPWATVQVDATDPSDDPATALSIRLRRPDGTWVSFRDGTSEVFFDRVSGASRLAAQFDATALATGAHNYTLVVRSHWSNETREASAAIRVLVVNERLNAWAPAPGWSIAGLQKSFTYGSDASGGIAITEGDGSILHFPRASCGSSICTHTSPRGDFTAVTRDRFSGAVQRRYPDGTLLEFTVVGDLAFSQDRFANRTTYSYGTNRRLTQVTDPAGKVIALGYNAAGKLATITDPGGRITRVEYDGNGNVYRVLRPDGIAAMTLSWGYWGGPYRFFGYTDAVGGQWSYDYDAFGKLATQTLPQVAINGIPERPVARFASLESRTLSATATSYTTRAAARIPAALRATTTNPRGYATAYQLDRFGAPLRVEEPLGRTTVIARNADAQPYEVTPPFGWPISYWWERQNLRAVYGGNRPYISYEYEPTYNEISKVSGDTPTTWNYWSGGKLDSTRTGSDSAAPSRMTYDGKGRLMTSGDPRSHGTKYYYATSGWQNSDSVVVGTRRTRHRYDALGRDTATTNPLDQMVRVTYDVLNRIIRTIGPMGDTTWFGYNASHLTSVTDSRGQTYGYVTNALGWTEQETDPRNLSDRYQYDRNGNLSRWTNRRNQDVTMTYDELDQPLTRTADGVTTAFRSDPLGRFTTASNPESTDTLWIDGDGRDSVAVTIRGGNAYRLTPTYERRGARTQVAMSGPGWTSSIGYRYDSYLGLDTLIDVAGGRTSMQYNPDRQPIAWNLPIAQASTVRGYSSTHAPAYILYQNSHINAAIGTRYGYDALSRVQEQLNSAQNAGRSFTRDSLGRLSHDSTFHYESTAPVCEPIYENNPPEPGDVPIRYSCTDSIQNKISDVVRTFTYDRVGNRTDLGAITETGNRLTSFNGLTLEYDADGNLTLKRQAGVPDKVLSWNSLGQLTSVTFNGSTTSFGYDGFGRRVRKSTNPSATVRYLYDGDNLIAELDHSYSVQAEYTYYPGVDRPHSVRRAGAMYYFALDHPGNVVGLIDGAGTLRNEYRYQAFGVREYAREDLSNISSLGYAARELDNETGFYFNRARYYDPELGRFISEDPVGLAGGINMFAYAGNDPVTYTDPFGLEPCEPGEYQHADDYHGANGKLVVVTHGCIDKTSGYAANPGDRGGSSPMGGVGVLNGSWPSASRPRSTAPRGSRVKAVTEYLKCTMNATFDNVNAFDDKVSLLGGSLAHHTLNRAGKFGLGYAAGRGLAAAGYETSGSGRLVGRWLLHKSAIGAMEPLAVQGIKVGAARGVALTGAAMGLGVATNIVVAYTAYRGAVWLGSAAVGVYQCA